MCKPHKSLLKGGQASSHAISITRERLALTAGARGRRGARVAWEESNTASQGSLCQAFPLRSEKKGPYSLRDEVIHSVRIQITGREVIM